MNTYRLRKRTGFCAYSDKGDDFGGFISDLHKSPVQFYGLQFKKGKLYGYVRSKDYDALCRLADSHSLEIEITAQKGLYYATQSYHKRWGFLLGALLAVCIVTFLRSRVLMIEIGGNERVSDEKIISLLRDNGIFIGSRISDVDLRAAEKMIIGMDKNIAWVGIRNTGSRVVVEIDELTALPQMERKNVPCNIVAARDAQITGVRLYSGMLIPMVGEGVKKGDIIVSGVVETKYGKSFYVHSIGEITGRYSEKMTFSQLLSDTQYVYGDDAVKKAVSIFGRRFTYYSEGAVEGEYEYYEEEKPLSVGKITFPISKVEMHYRLIEPVAVMRTEQEAEQLIRERIARYEQNHLTDKTVIDKQIYKSSDGERVTITVEYTIEGEIGAEKPIFVEH